MRRKLRRRAKYFRHEQHLHLYSLQRRVRRPLSLLGISKKSFLVGPTNSANQGSEWSKALSRSGFTSRSLRISTDPDAEWFATDIAFARHEWLIPSFRKKFEVDVARNVDVFLFESLRPIFRPRDTKDSRNLTLQDFDFMKRIGKKSGVIFHGSDIRDVDSHTLRSEFSPFHTNRPELEQVRIRSNENRALLPEIRARKIPIFVSTKDLLTDVPDARWLPVAIDFPKFAEVATNSPLFASSKLRVLFLPSRSWVKSAELIEPILRKLSKEEVIDYVNPGPIKHGEVPELLSRVDLVIDQFLGVVGVFPIEALAAGRLVMSYVPSGSSDAPIINITPETLEAELRRVASERPMPVQGVDYAKKWHDGRASVEVITKSFG